jgi:hypothetical protein
MYSYLILTPSILLSNKNLIKFVKQLGQTATTILLLKGMGCQFHLKQKIDEVISRMHENPELIDFIFVNHITTVDFLFMVSYLQALKIENFNFVLRKGVIFNPVVGLTMYANSDIKLNRKWEIDKTIINKQLDNIDTTKTKQVIVIFPEGTRITDEKLKAAQKFSRENNLPVFNNLQVPKTKGSWMMIKHLAETNRLGKIWDVTMAVPSIIDGRGAYIEDIMSKNVGPIYTDIRELKLNNEYKDMETFKTWFLNNWKDKDDFLENYSKMTFNPIDFSDLRYHHIIHITFVSIIGILLLMNNISRYYVLMMVILAYILTIFGL